MSNKPKLLFLITGGTISQIPKVLKSGKTILVPPQNADDFIELILPAIKKYQADFDIAFELFSTKDSTNMIPEDWTTMINRVLRAQNEEDYQAVAITHGTDTLAYSAGALSLGLHGSNPNGSSLKIPVVITGSQLSMHVPNSDGEHNLSTMFETLKVALENQVVDVLVNFDQEVFLGARVIKVSEVNLNAFAAPLKTQPVGKVRKDGKVVLGFSQVHQLKDFVAESIFAHQFARGIVSIDLVPGSDPSIVSAILHTGNVSAIVLRCFGEGNVCFEGYFNMLPVIKVATEKNIPVFITSKIPSGNALASNYEVGFKAVEAGAIPCYDQTDVMVVIKIAWLLGNGLCKNVDDFREAMRTNYVGELCTTSF